MPARAIVLLVVAAALAGCADPVDSGPRGLLPVPGASAPATTTDALWTELRITASLGARAALAVSADGDLLLVSPSGLARSSDEGVTWTTTPVGRERTSYTNRGGEPWVDRGVLNEAWYPHGRLESDRPILAAGATARDVLVFAVGTYGTLVERLPLTSAMGEADARVYLTTGGLVDDVVGYAGPRLASFDVPERPVLAGTVRYRTLVYVPSDREVWRAAWRGPENGPEPVAIRMVTPALGYLLFADGTLLETSDGLATWQTAGSLPPGVARDARAIAPVGATGLVVVGRRGLVLVSSDRGRTWRRGSCPEDLDLTRVIAAPPRVWAVGRAGAVAASADNGCTFERVSLPIGRSLDSLIVYHGRAWILAGDRAFISPSAPEARHSDEGGPNG